MQRAAREIWVSMAVLAMSTYFLIHLVRTTDWSTSVALSPTSMPLFVISLVVLFSLALLVTTALQLRKLRGESPDTPRPSAATAAEAPATGRGLALLGWTVLYLMALPWLGYLITTTVYTGGLAGLFGNRKPLSIILMMILVPVLLLFFFERYLRIWLPDGRLFQ